LSSPARGSGWRPASRRSGSSETSWEESSSAAVVLPAGCLLFFVLLRATYPDHGDTHQGNNRGKTIETALRLPTPLPLGPSRRGWGKNLSVPQPQPQPARPLPAASSPQRSLPAPGAHAPAPRFVCLLLRVWVQAAPLHVRGGEGVQDCLTAPLVSREEGAFQILNRPFPPHLSAQSRWSGAVAGTKGRGAEEAFPYRSPEAEEFHSVGGFIRRHLRPLLRAPRHPRCGLGSSGAVRTIGARARARRSILVRFDEWPVRACVTSGEDRVPSWLAAARTSDVSRLC